MGLARKRNKKTEWARKGLEIEKLAPGIQLPPGTVCSRAITRHAFDDFTHPVWEFHPEIEKSPWFAAFVIYRDMSPHERSLRAAWRLGSNNGENKAVGAMRTWQSWCGGMQWVRRAREYDRYLDTLKRKRREDKIEIARDYLIDNMFDVTKRAVRAALGKAGAGDLPQSQTTMMKDVLDRAGLVKPKQIEVSGPMGEAIPMEHAPKRELDNKQAIEVAELLKQFGGLDLREDNDDGETDDA